MHVFSACYTVTEVISLIFLHKIQKWNKKYDCIVEASVFVKTANVQPGVQKPQGRHQTTSKRKTHFSFSLNCLASNPNRSDWRCLAGRNLQLVLPKRFNLCNLTYSFLSESVKLGWGSLRMTFPPPKEQLNPKKALLLSFSTNDDHNYFQLL